jgi:hypothetical protein
MRRIIMIIILMSQSLLVLAGQPLNKELITSFYATTDGLEALSAKYPTEFDRMDEFSMVDQKEMIRYIKSTRAYSDISSILTSNGFSNLRDFFDVAIRVMGSMYLVQMRNLPMGQEDQFDVMEKSLQSSINSMRQDGVPDEMIADMNHELMEMQSQKKEMELAVRKTSKADIKFVRENMRWLVSIMPDEDAHSKDIH